MGKFGESSVIYLIWEYTNFTNNYYTYGWSYFLANFLSPTTINLANIPTYDTTIMS